MNASCHTWMSHGTHMGWLQIWVISHMIASCHTWMSHGTHMGWLQIWVISVLNDIAICTHMSHEITTHMTHMCSHSNNDIATRSDNTDTVIDIVDKNEYLNCIVVAWLYIYVDHLHCHSNENDYITYFVPTNDNNDNAIRIVLPTRMTTSISLPFNDYTYVNYLHCHGVPKRMTTSLTLWPPMTTMTTWCTLSFRQEWLRQWRCHSNTDNVNHVQCQTYAETRLEMSTHMSHMYVCQHTGVICVHV